MSGTPDTSQRRRREFVESFNELASLIPPSPERTRFEDAARQFLIRYDYLLREEQRFLRARANYNERLRTRPMAVGEKISRRARERSKTDEKADSDSDTGSLR